MLCGLCCPVVLVGVRLDGPELDGTGLDGAMADVGRFTEAETVR